MPKAKTTTKPKVKKKPRKKPAVKVTWNPDKKLTDKEELFCRYYVQNEGTRLNATQAYNLAYGKELEKQDTEDVEYGTRTNRHGKEEEYVVKKSSYDLCQNLCSVEGNRHLRKPHIERRKYELLNEMLTDEIVDGELMKVINQDSDRPSKIRAINEYNKLGSRIEEKKSIMHSFGADDMSDEELDKEIAKEEKFFKKK